MGPPTINQRVEALEERLADLGSSISDLVAKSAEKSMEALRHSLTELLCEHQTLAAQKLGTKVEALPETRHAGF